jgi:ribose 5-phosphate isomerase A
LTKIVNAEIDLLKRAAATRAVEEIQNGMVVGLGSGTTAAFALEAMAKRINEGLSMVGVPSSEKTAAIARQLNVPLTDFDTHPHIDLTIDGADQVERSTLNLIKGLGGSLLREKIVAAASTRMIVIVDSSKVVDRLGSRTPLPIEVVPFGWQATFGKLDEIGCKPSLRTIGGIPFITDEGNYIADCSVGEVADASTLGRQITNIVGVVETGLFIDLASMIVVGGINGIEIIRK